MAEPSSTEINDLLERSVFGIQSATAATSAPGEAGDGDVFERMLIIMPAIAYVSLLRNTFVRSVYVFLNSCALFQNPDLPRPLSSNGKGCLSGNSLVSA